MMNEVDFKRVCGSDPLRPFSVNAIVDGFVLENLLLQFEMMLLI